jgi:TolB-like protein/tRNA A-37 threonylcarbamoyl transferase component Bud32
LLTDAVQRLSAALADRYAIEREIGSGGMATVYLARDLKHDRQVALKVLRPELAATLGPDRFPREIRILAKLQHPHVLPLLDSGESAGFLYYVMPYVEGESLRQRLERDGPMSVHDAVRVLREVSDALAYAHAHGVLHRDIKPDNVMLSGRHALVTDFGVAKAVSDAGGEKLTTVGVAVGTPTYMSPEQATGDVNVDHRSDIYAVGILGYELLSGKPPFVAPTAQAVLSAQVLERPKPVTERRAAVPEVLSDLLLRCLEKNPADRWQSAEEVLHALEAMATPSGGITPTNTRPVKATDARRPAPLRRWVMGAVAGVIVVVAAAGVVLVARGDSAVGPNHIAVLPLQDISGADAQFVDAMHDQLIISLGQAGGLTVAPRSAMMIYKSQPKPMSEVARDLKVGAILEGTVFRTGDRMRINVQLTEPRSIRQLWSHSYEINVRDVLGAQDSVVRQIAAGIRQAVTTSAATSHSP